MQNTLVCYTYYEYKKCITYSAMEVIMRKFINQEKGFTLAEVLITLGIIGIIAAMTLPAIIANKKRSELKSQLLAGYSLLQQALQRMNADYGYPVIPSEYKSRKFKPEYIKYFESPVDCEWGGVHSTKASTLCGKGASVTGEDGSKSELIEGIYMTYNKASDKISSVPLDDGQFALKNGMLIMIENITSLFITIDVNGINKKPNVWGEDLFTFQLMENGKLLPMGADGTSYSEDKFCSKTSTNTLNGIACTQKALTDKSYWNGI